MRALTGKLALEAWDRASAEQEVTRPLALLEVALPESGRDELSAMPLARRNALLLEVRALTFGPVMQGLAACPECGARLEFALPVADLLSAIATPAPGRRGDGARTSPMRPVNTDDLLACAQRRDPGDARMALAARCMEPRPAVSLAGLENGENGTLEDVQQEWPPHWLAEFEALNANAEIRCAADCPECASHPVFDVDVAAFLWQEVRASARGLLHDVHRLASAYGWTEDAILSLSGARRQAYLERIDG